MGAKVVGRGLGFLLENQSKHSGRSEGGGDGEKEGMGGKEEEEGGFEVI